MQKINRYRSCYQCFFLTGSVVTEGETSSYDSKTDSGAVITRHFCPTCGSRLFGKHSEKSGVIAVTAGTMDNNDWFKPNFIVYNKSRPAWDFIDESLPIFDAMPPAQQ